MSKVEIENMYAVYLGHFTRKLLGESPKAGPFTMPEITAATLGVADAGRGLLPAPMREVASRVSDLLRQPEAS